MICSYSTTIGPILSWETILSKTECRHVTGRRNELKNCNSIPKRGDGSAEQLMKRLIRPQLHYLLTIDHLTIGGKSYVSPSVLLKSQPTRPTCRLAQRRPLKVCQSQQAWLQVELVLFAHTYRPSFPEFLTKLRPRFLTHSALMRSGFKTKQLPCMMYTLYVGYAQNVFGDSLQCPWVPQLGSKNLACPNLCNSRFGGFAIVQIQKYIYIRLHCRRMHCQTFLANSLSKYQHKATT